MKELILLFALFSTQSFAVTEINVFPKASPQCGRITVSQWTKGYMNCMAKLQPQLGVTEKLNEKANQACQCMTNKLLMEPDCEKLSKIETNVQERNKFSREIAFSCR